MYSSLSLFLLPSPFVCLKWLCAHNVQYTAITSLIIFKVFTIVWHKFGFFVWADDLNTFRQRRKDSWRAFLFIYKTRSLSRELIFIRRLILFYFILFRYDDYTCIRILNISHSNRDSQTANPQVHTCVVLFAVATGILINGGLWTPQRHILSSISQLKKKTPQSTTTTHKYSFHWHCIPLHPNKRKRNNNVFCI